MRRTGLSVIAELLVYFTDNTAHHLSLNALTIPCSQGNVGTCLFVCLLFNGTFTTNRLYHAIVVGYISHRAGGQ